MVLIFHLRYCVAVGSICQLAVRLSIWVSMFHFEVPVEVDLVEGLVPAGVANDLVVLLLKVAVQGLLAVALKWDKSVFMYQHHELLCHSWDHKMEY